MISREHKGSFQQMKTRFFDRVLDTELSELTRSKWLIHSLIKLIMMVARDFFENLVKLQAMALAFKTLLSLAPLLAVIFSILKGLGVHNRMEPALAEALAPLGEKGQEITAHLIGFVDKMSAGALGSIGMATLFVTVISLMGTIEEAFNHIWHVKAPRKLARKFSDYLSVILVGPVLIFAAVTITATLQSNTFVHKLMSLEPFGTLILAFLRLVPYLTLWGAFTFIYVFVPNTRVKLRSALVGGLAAAVLWQTVGWGFTVFVASSTRYYAIYSSFAILLFFLLWLHVSWVIVSLGAQVAYAHQHIHFFEPDRENIASSPAGRERMALEFMFLIGRNFHDGLDPLTVSELANRLRLPAGMIKDLMEVFQRTKLALPLADDETFVLSRAPETISVKDILDCVRNAGPKTKLNPSNRNHDERQIDTLLSKVDQSMAEALEGKSLQKLILGEVLVSQRKSST